MPNDSDVRCDVLANVQGKEINFHENIEGLREWPMRFNWDDGEISYRLNNYSSDFLESWQTRAVVVALRCWQLRITKLKFRRERNRDTNVDFDISFEPKDHFNSDNILAFAYFPGQGDISGDVHINDNWDWQPGVHLSDMGRPPLVPVMIHEFGHSLGLRHDTLSSSMNKEIMYPSINFGTPTNKLGPRDVERIQERYGIRNLPNFIIRYFQNRRNQGWDFF